jgi:5-methyltetrahydrofolate--homocysteine methyltransferase
MSDLLFRLGESLLAGHDDETRQLTTEALESGTTPQGILDAGMRPAMERLGDRFSRGEAYLPELLLAAETMKVGMEVLKPAIISGGVAARAKMILGTVEGDIHDIGKNLVKMMFQGAGYEVVDLATNVNAQTFLDAYKREKPDLVGLSALLTTTIAEMEKVIGMIRKEDPSARFLVGGAPITSELAEKMGANGYAPDAGAAVKVGNGIVGI